HVAITVNGSASETVNIGNAGSVQGILAPVTVQNPPSFTTLNINDSADTTARTAGISTAASAGTSFAARTGLPPADIPYQFDDTSIVNPTPGTGADPYTVRVTGVPVKPSTSGGRDTVNIGNAGSVQGIIGRVTIQNPLSTDTINIDDSADQTARDATLS